ncbi:hypothetical protein D3C80_1361060 [compost metagenome]
MRLADGLGLVAGDAADLAIAGAFDHQQRQRAGGARLQHQQAVVLEDVAEQGHRGEHLAEQLGDRLGVGVLGQHLAVTLFEVDQFAAHIGVVEQETLGKI